jgi:hypothetical protein
MHPPRHSSLPRALTFVTSLVLGWTFSGWTFPDTAATSPPASDVVAATPSSEAARRRTGRSRWRRIDGRENNRRDPSMGAAGTPLRRHAPAAYADGVSALAGPGRPSARAVSNAVVSQPHSLLNTLGLSDYLWQWGQFLDHDLDLTETADPAEPAPIPVPAGDPMFDPGGSGSAIIGFSRSAYDGRAAATPARPRQQMNTVTAWIDASNVYGSDDVRAAALRANDGTGRLRTSAGDFLPFNTAGLPNGGGPDPTLFLAGDVRANEQVGLTALHTLFVREHNRLAAEISARHPRLSDEKIYQRARRLVGAQMQVITYHEFLPGLLGANAVAPYRGYRRRVDARIRTEFSTAAYRFGHSTLSPILRRLDADGQEIPEGSLPLREAFFAPHRILDEGGIEPLLRGLASQACQTLDTMVVEDVRSFLFGPPGAGGFDLPALNVQRGRDHGLPDHNTVRVAYGLPAAATFADVTADPTTQARLASVYGDVHDVDPWVGALAEDPMPGAMVGPLVMAVLVEQFEAVRDGDRYWYTRTLGRRERREVERTRLADIIRRNTTIGDEIPDDVFHAPAP